MIILIVNILILLLLDLFSFRTLSSGRIVKSTLLIKWLKFTHLIFSVLTWTVIIIIAASKSEFAENSNIARMMFMGLLLSAIWLPRLIVLLFSNIAYLVAKWTPNLSGWLNTAGKIIAVTCIVLVITGSLFGRFNFRYDDVTIEYNNLPPDLEGLRIIQLSDLHLSSFHNHPDKLEKVIGKINKLNADIIINTGDFVTIAWNEMPPFCEILARAESRYGNFAIPGNHDAGTYHPYFSEEEKLLNIVAMDSLIKLSGYHQLKDSNSIISIDTTDIRLAGVVTLGSIPNIFYGNLEKALGNEDVTDFTILMSHDPNHWYYDLQDRTDIDLTLSGHTHAMQLGFRIGKFQWSPASFIFPAWSGLYGKNGNYLYVNRGLGTISFPFRIGMPPEITIITLKGL